MDDNVSKVQPLAEGADKIQIILDKVYSYDDDTLLSRLDKTTFPEFITKIVNGDTVTECLVIPATLSQGAEGILVYILTKAKLIKVTIADTGQDIKSDSTYLRDIIGGVKRSLNVENGEKRAEISIEFPEDEFSLGYSAGNKKIDDFFLAVDNAIGKLKGQ